MKIKNKQTLNLMRKILCSRQLFHHSNLCKTYVELVKLSAENSNKITPEDSTRAQKKYTRKLASAAKGNLDFLYNSKEDITKGIFSDSHTKKEIELFNLLVTGLNFWCSYEEITKEYNINIIL